MTRTFILRAVLALAGALACAFSPAIAGDNILGAQSDTAKTPYFLRCFQIGAADSQGRFTCAPGHIALDATGTPLFTTGNPGTVALSTGTSVTVSNLPANPPTSTLQTTGNTSLASIDAKLPGKGAAASAASLPVVIAADQAGFPVVHTPTSAAGSVSAATVGTTAAQALAAPSGGTRRFLAIDNESTTATVACTFGTAVTAAINTAGSFTIGAGQTRTWGNTFVPADALYCVASAAGTPVTLQAY